MSVKELAQSFGKWVRDSVGVPRYLHNEFFDVVADCSVPLRKRIEDAGFWHVNESIVRYCAGGKVGIIEASIHLDPPCRALFFSDALRFIDGRRQVSVGIDELVALATRYPRIQKFFPIAALHNPIIVPRGETFSIKVPFLGAIEGKSILGLHDTKEEFPDNFRFATAAF